MKNLFNRICNDLNLGQLLEEPIKVTGGLTHSMYKINTTNGKYIIKLLNSNIMKRSNALDNFKKAEALEKVLEKNNIECIYSLEFNNKKMQRIDDIYYYVFNWYNGTSLKDTEITLEHCEKIGKVLSDIHNIDLQYEKFSDDPKNINWEFYINKAKFENEEVYDLIYDKLDLLNDSMNKGNIALNKMPNVICICHNDMDSKNVLWNNNKYKIIDLECLGYYNPYLELFELALCWSGYESCNIDFNKFNAFINSNFSNSKLDRNIDWEALYYFNNGRLLWLEYNLKRVLGIECSSKEEYEIGMKEVKETIEHIVYYDKVKEEILENLKVLFGEFV